MQFIERKHYCFECKKNVHFLTFTTTTFIEKEHLCPICKRKVFSFWHVLKTKYVLYLIIGISFLVNSVIYSFWIISRKNLFTVDIVNIIIDVLIASIFAILGLKHREKSIIPILKEAENKIIELKDFRKQTLYVLFLVVTAISLAFLLNFITYLIFY